MGRNEFVDDSMETRVMGRYPTPGTLLLGKYLVVSLVGEGGMGVVLKCKHVELEEFVAIKCLLPEMLERTDIVQRFLREAKAAAKLKGEHVARVFDVGRFPDTSIPYIVMEFLEGADLNAIIKHHGAQDSSIAVDLILQACEAIAEAHSIGIIHRDIKASNFFITQPPNQAPVLKVLDFGIATAPEGTSELTSTQSVIGTPSYMAPEQMRSSRDADARSDIWSIGVVLYELLEGARPFRSEVYSELCLKVGMDPPHPMVHPEVPEGLRQIVLRCLEKSVERRYQSVAELAFDLMPYASDQVAGRAAVEQTARLLGRRSRPDQTASRATPTPGAHPATPISTSQPSLPGPEVGMVLGHPTPIPVAAQPKSSTSIGGSSGEVAVLPMSPRPRRRGLVVASTALIVLGLAGGGAYVASSQGWLGGGQAEKALDSAAAAQPLPPPAAEPATPSEPRASAKDPAAEPTKEPAEPTPKDPEVKTPESEPAKEPVPTPEAVKQPVKEAVKQPVKEVVKEPVKPPVKPAVTRPSVSPTTAANKPATNPTATNPTTTTAKPEPDVPGGDLYKRRR